MAREVITREIKKWNPDQPHLLEQAVKRAMKEGTLIFDFLSTMKKDHVLLDTI